MPLWIAGVILLVAVALFVVGVIFVRRASRSKRLDNHWSQGASRLGKWFISFGVLLFFWDFFAYEGANLIGAPFWFPVIVLAYLIWLGFIVNYFVGVLPKKRAEIKEKSEKEKYLPKPKK